MKIPERVTNLLSAPFDYFVQRARRLREQHYHVVDMGQAVPNLPLPVDVLEEMAVALANPELYKYSYGKGIDSLRQLLARNLEMYSKVRIDPDEEIIITAGANQAFMLVILTLLDYGDKVLLPSPYYIGHAMAVQAIGGRVVEVPLEEKKGFQLTAEEVLPFFQERPKLLVLVSPNNPTGAVYSSGEIKKIISLAKEYQVTVVVDETYQPYTYGDVEHFNPLSVRDFINDVIVIGGFSKLYNICGWRVGYLLGARRFISNALKIQEPMMICAPVISQVLAEKLLRKYGLRPEKNILMMQERRQKAIECFTSLKGLRWTPTNGAYFSFARLTDRTSFSDSFNAALRLLEEAMVVSIPGRYFGRYGEGFLRLSYGSVSIDDLEEACQRLRLFFGTLD